MTKRTFDLLAVMTLSAALFVACGGDDPAPTPDGGMGGSGGGGGGAGGMDARADGPADGPVGGADARPEAGADAAVDGARDGSDGAMGADATAMDTMASADMAGDGSAGTPAQLLDQCFTGLPAAVGTQNVDTKASSDGNVVLRTALDTEDRFGTSGTKPWGLLRFGLVRGGTSVCVTVPADLVYKGSHHNCMDTATVTANGVRYELVAPDRATTKVSAFMGNTKLYGPVDVTRTACSTNVGAMCASGGPCN